MRFRTKTILGVAVIEMVLLAILVGSVVSVLGDSSETELKRRVQLGSQLLAVAAKDALISQDLATLDSLVDEAMASGQIDYVRIIDAGPLVATLEVTRTFGAAGGSTSTERITVRAGSPLVDIAFDIDWHETEHLLSLMVPLQVHAREAACDIQFGHVMRPTHVSSSWDAAKFEVCAHRFVSMAEPAFGVAVLNDGRYGHCVQDGGIRVSLLRAATYPDPLQDQGRHTCTIGIMPHGAGLLDVVHQAEALNLPLRPVQPGIALSVPQPAIIIDGAGVELSAVKRADDGSGDLVVRMYEVTGNRTTISVRLPHRVNVAATCNLLEEPEHTLETSDGIATLTLAPFQLVTLRLS